MENQVEIWKDIVGYEGLYQVSNLGNVKSIRVYPRDKKYVNKNLKPVLQKIGYYSFTLCRENSKKIFMLHRLISEAFIDNNNNKPCVNHINGIKTDNRIENLEWVTYSENSKHAHDNNLQVSIKGSSHCNSKLTEDQVVEIRNAYIKGSGIYHRHLAEKYNVSRELIRDVINRKKWKHI